MTNWKAIAGKIAAVVLVIAMIAAVLLPARNMGQDAPVTASVVKGGSMQKTTQDVSITAFAATLDKTPAVVDFIAVDAEVSEIVIPEAARYLAADETSAAVQAIPAVQLHKEEAEAKAQAEAEAAAAAQRAAEQKAAEEAAKKAAEQKAAEEARKAAEQKAAEEAARKAEEQKAAEEAAKKAEESKKEESSKAEESKKEESSKAEESKKEESSEAEESKKEESSKAEESKKEESSKAEEPKTEESSAAEQPAEPEPESEPEPEPEPADPVDDSPLNAYMGVNYYNGHKETYYNMYMGGLIEAMNRGGWAYNDCINKDIIDNILDTSGYWIRSDGCKMFGSYIILAASEYEYRRGSIVSTSLGTGIVLDRGVGPGVIDIAVNW